MKNGEELFIELIGEEALDDEIDVKVRIDVAVNDL